MTKEQMQAFLIDWRAKDTVYRQLLAEAHEVYARHQTAQKAYMALDLEMTEANHRLDEAKTELDDCNTKMLSMVIQNLMGRPA